MKVRELIETLGNMPQDAEVIHDRFSDYELLQGPTLVRGVRRPEWVMRVYASQLETMSESDKANVETFVHL